MGVASRFIYPLYLILWSDLNDCSTEYHRLHCQSLEIIAEVLQSILMYEYSSEYLRRIFAMSNNICSSLNSQRNPISHLLAQGSCEGIEPTIIQRY